MYVRNVTLGIYVVRVCQLQFILLARVLTTKMLNPGTDRASTISNLNKQKRLTFNSLLNWLGDKSSQWHAAIFQGQLLIRPEIRSLLFTW